VPHGIGRPIGIFDSGVGGFTVLRACIAALPGEDVVYFGDTAWFPYGERDPVEVRARALAIGGWLARQGVKLVAVACNTATAVALPDLQRALPQPVVGPIRPDVHADDPRLRRGRAGDRGRVPGAGRGGPERGAARPVGRGDGRPVRRAAARGRG
jgi:glutamate racemase